MRLQVAHWGAVPSDIRPKKIAGTALCAVGTVLRPMTAACAASSSGRLKCGTAFSAFFAHREVDRRSRRIVLFHSFFQLACLLPQTRGVEKTKAPPFGSALAIMILSYFCSSRKGSGFISIFSVDIMLFPAGLHTGGSPYSHRFPANALPEIAAASAARPFQAVMDSMAHRSFLTSARPGKAADSFRSFLSTSCCPYRRYILPWSSGPYSCRSWPWHRCRRS